MPVRRVKTDERLRYVSNISGMHMQVVVRSAVEDCAGIQERLKEYHEVLLRGLGFFKPPAPSSRKAVEIETSLAIGKKKIPVDPTLRSIALELSGYLVRTETAVYRACLTGCDMQQTGTFVLCTVDSRHEP